MATKPVQCYVVRKAGDSWHVDPRRLTIRMDPTTDMIGLRKAVRKEGCEEGLFEADNAIELWLPKEDIRTGRDAVERVTKGIKNAMFDDLATPADDTQTVDSIMRNIRSERQFNYIHVLVEVILRQPIPEPPGQDPVITADFFDQKFQLLLLNARAARSPSVNAKSIRYREYQRSLFPFLDGRYAPFEDSPATLGPPIELFNPVFAQFRTLAGDTTVEIPSDVITATASIVRSASVIRSVEDDRTLPSRFLLSSVLKRSFIQSTNLDESSPDHVALGTTNRFSRPESTALALVEEKGEMGTGVDPSVQGCFSYMKFWLSDDHSQVRNECCCPTFIIALAGSWLAILGAVTTSQYIFQRLTNYLWLGNSRVSDDIHVISVARVLYALRRSLESLERFYEDLDVRPIANGGIHSRHLPSITSYSLNNTAVTFTYVKPLELDSACMAFLATLNSNGQEIVVKFVQRYGAVVHQYMAEIGMAPELLYYGPIDQDGHSYGELKMVVMAYVRGETLAQRFKTGTIPRNVTKAIRDGVTAIHDAGYVYGDLRRPNVMITNAADGVDDLGGLVRFIDFDWAGKAGDVRYPLHLSEEICEIAETSEFELIEKKHDIAMLEAV